MPHEILVTTYEDGANKLFAVETVEGKAREIIGVHAVEAVDISTVNGSDPLLVFQLSSYQAPADLYTIAASGNSPINQITTVNAGVLPKTSLPRPTHWTFKGASDDDVQAWVFHPHNFDASKKYPVALYCHGGPESPWSDQWSYRWNPQVLAAQGYAVLAINFHGSPGFGQKFTDSILRDWGGKPFEDQILGLQQALKTFSFMDETNIVGLGASYGGFTMAWMQSHAPKGLFRTLVLHDGIFDLRAMYYSTEELWFPENEMGGNPMSARQEFDKWSPANYVDKWETPMLIIHGEQDFRIPYTEGISAFTALQRKGVESKLILFPNEDHWVMEPNNSILWHDEVIGWINKFANK